MNEEKTTFITSDAKNSSLDIAENPFGELDFGSISPDDLGVSREKKPLLPMIYEISGVVLIVIAILGSLLTGDMYLRTVDASFLPSGICSLFAPSIDGYKSDTCQTLETLSGSINTEKKGVEGEIAKNLEVLIPNKLLITNIATLPEVGFIIKKTTERIDVQGAIDAFEKVKKDANEEASSIDCKDFSLDEKGETSIQCNFYGASLIIPKGRTSRMVALNFLKKIQEKGSHFLLLEYPKELSVSEYNSADGDIKSTFTTQTSLTLLLKYIPENLKN